MINWPTNRFLVTIIAVCATLTACSEHESIVLSDAWFRLSPPGHDVSAAFLSIENQTDASVIVLSAESPIAERIEIHLHSHENGVMRMRQVKQLEVGAKSSLSLAPGGYHLMLFGISTDIKEGESYPLTLTVEGMPPFTTQMASVMPGA